MRGAVAGLAIVALSAGCAHLRLRDGPGDVDLARAPPAIEARGATLPRPTTDRALLLSPGVLAGLGARQGDGGMNREAGLGFELGIHATHIKLDEMVLGNSRRDHDFGQHPRAWGVNLGWTPSGTRTPAETSHQPAAYVEGQWWNQFGGVAAGAAFTPGDSRRSRSAVQIAPLLGPFYGRFQFLLDGNIAFEVGIALKIPFLVSWGS